MKKSSFEKKLLTYASWISMQIKASSFLHILNVYSHTKLNTPVLVWSLQLSNSDSRHRTFSVTIDYVRFPIRRFPLYTYSMVHDADFNLEFVQYWFKDIYFILQPSKVLFFKKSFLMEFMCPRCWFFHGICPTLIQR